MIFGSGADWIPFIGPAYGDISLVAPYWLVVAALAVLVVRPGTTRSGRGAGMRGWGRTLPARSSWWLLVPVCCWALQFVQFGFPEHPVWTLIRARA